MIKIFSSVCLFIVAPGVAVQGQSTLPQSIAFKAQGSMNRTNNSTSYLFNNGVRYKFKAKRTTLNSAADWVYGQANNHLTNNDFTTMHDVNLFNQNGNFYKWGRATYTTSYSLKINRQVQAGLGVAYNFVNTDSAWLNISDGFLFEASSLAISSSAEDNYKTVRNSLRLSYRFLAGIFTFDGANFYQPSLRNGSDYIVRFTNTIGVNISSWLKFTTSFDFNRLNRTNRESLLATYGITIERRF